MLRILVLFLFLASLSACGVLPSLEDETENWTARQLYEESKKALSAADYETALRHLETLEARFPFGRYAQQAQLDMIYAYYKFDEPESSIAAADRFIKLYPRHPRVSYAYYMRGLSSYEYKKSFLDRVFRLDPTERDNAAPQEAFQYFSTLIRLYPESDYAKDAALRLRHLHNLLARHELHVADYYYRREAFVAAANRASYTIVKFPRSQAARDALVILVKAYNKLGLNDLATDALHVLEVNDPDNPELKKLKKTLRIVS